jgi:RHS repeat-associated protein
MSVSIRVAITLVVLAASSAPSFGQGQGLVVDNTTSTPSPGVGHEYISDLNETVNPANGAVNVSIQVPLRPGRLLTLPFGIGYNSTRSHYQYETQTVNTLLYNPGWSQGGWAYMVPMMTANLGQQLFTCMSNKLCICPMFNNYVFTDAAGGGHSLGLRTGVTSQTECTVNSTPNLDLYYVNAVYNFASPPPPINTGGDYEFQASTTPLSGSTNTGPTTVQDRNGTKYYFVSPQSGYGLTQVAPNIPQYVEDRNGNKINMSKGSTLGALTITDTLGTSVLSTTGFGSTGANIDVAGTSSPYTLTWGTQSVNYSMGVTVASDSGLFSGDCNGRSASFSGQASVLTGITLPNGTAFHFTYDSVYGNLAKIVYPTGAYVRYQWGVNTRSDSATGTYQLISGSGSSVVGNVLCGFQFDMPAITDRWVSFDGVTEALHQHFSYSTAWGTGVLWTSKSTTITTYDLVLGTSSTTTHSYVPDPQTGGGIWSVYQSGMSSSSVAGSPTPVESSTTVADYGGNVLQTTNNTWDNVFALAQQTVTVGSGSAAVTRKAVYTYDTDGQLTEEDDYDYSASSPSKKRLISYQGFGFANLLPKLVDRPCKTIIADGAGNSFAERDTYYDGGTALCSLPAGQQLAAVSGLPPNTHDETNYGTASSTLRGNVTQQVQIASSGTSPKSTFTYDETGQRTSFTDPCGSSTCSDMSAGGHTTYYAYDDNPSGDDPAGDSNAYLTRITLPPVNVSHTRGFSYDYETGNLTSATDENGHATSYQYSDLLNRLTQVSYSDGGETTYSYNDSVPEVTSQTLINSGALPMVSVKKMDGMLHVIQSQLTSDPGGTDIVDTKYDGRGRVHSVSNPYRDTSTDGTKYFYFDALDRPIETVHQDGSSNQTCYQGAPSTPAVSYCSASTLGSATSGVREDSTDEVGNHWERIHDAFGRLTRVMEPNGTTSMPSMETDYVYDPLDNLVSATQWGGASGAAGARTRSFSYDKLSRLIQAYNPESGWTCYGTSSGAPSGSNCTEGYDGNGNLIYKTDARGIRITFIYDALNRLLQKSASDNSLVYSYSYDDTSRPNGIGRLAHSSNNVNGAASYYYDAMGRVTDRYVCVPGNCTYTLGAWQHYDLAGNAVESNLADGILVSSTYDSAGRLNGVTTNVSGTLVSSTTYGAAGLTNDHLGNGVTETFGYDNRMRLHAYSAVKSPSTNYSYSLVYAGNGNVMSVSDSANGGSWTDSYDTLNRLLTAGSATTGISWTYDAFGNRWKQTMTLGSGTQPNFTFNNTLNRIDQYCFDAAGNILDENGCPQPGGVHQFAYDGEGKLISSNSGNITYIYDGDGKRIAKATNGTVTNVYFYDIDGHRVVDTDGSISVQRTELYGGNRHLATYGGTVVYNHANWLGSEEARTDAGGSICQTVSSFPFGDDGQVNGSCATSTPNFFTGKERDAESGNDYFGARYYASTMGRWMSPDPINLTNARLLNPANTLNKYVYGANNPLKYVDLDGKDITIFYIPPSNPFETGHVLVGAVNQDTGASAMMDFYPKVTSPSLIMFNVPEPGEFRDPSGDSLVASSLTIRTTPEEANTVITAIKQLESGQAPTYQTFSNNCTTEVQDVLKDIGLIDPGDFDPNQYWYHMYSNYSAAAMQNPFAAFGPTPHAEGHEYGNPRNFGMSYADLFFRLQAFSGTQEPKATVTTTECVTLPGGTKQCD